MMYNGIDYQATWNTNRGSNTSIEGKKHPYLKKGFWKEEKNHFWKNDNYSEKGKQYCEENLVSLQK